MSQAPETFPDPIQTPTVFEPVEEKPITLYGQTEFPVSFVIDPLPRPAVVTSIVAKHMGVFYSNKDVYTDPTVVQNIPGESLTFELYADNKDILNAGFHLKIPKTSGGYYFYSCGDLADIRQPQMATDTSQVFSMTASTQLFNRYLYLGSYRFPTATLYLQFSPHLEDDAHTWVPILLPDKTSTNVMMAPANTYGVMDILATVKVKWYMNRARTVVSPVSPFDEVGCSYGLRFYVTKGASFLNRTEITSDGVGVVSSVYPTSYLSSISQSPMSIFYWGLGELSSDIFNNYEASVDVSDNGLPVQGGFEVGAYVLNNDLPDIYSSSSSSSTEARSTSNTENRSTSSATSSSTIALSSSLSSSTQLMSTSSASSSSESSQSESTSSTLVLLSSSSSSLGYHSSFEDEPVLQYEFSNEPQNRLVVDSSGMGNDALTGYASGTLAPPIWGLAYGMGGAGGMWFTANANASDYIQGESFNGIRYSTRGTILMWLKGLPNGNNVSIPMSVSNGFVQEKTELCVGLDVSSGQNRVFAYLTIRNTIRWKIQSSIGSFSNNTWTLVALVHDSRTPRLYIDGIEDWQIVAGTSKKDWLRSVFNDYVPADRLILGGAPRYYQPFVTQGFNGYMDEVSIWDVPLSGSRISYINLAGMSSSSSSTVP